jgi:hypothetical protein
MREKGRQGEKGRENERRGAAARTCRLSVISDVLHNFLFLS